MSGSPDRLSSDARGRLARIADTMIPAGNSLPSASEAGVHASLLDQVLKARPDLLEPLLAALEELGPDADLNAVDALAEREPRRYEALSLVVAGGYLMSREVAARVEYPFQEAKPVDPRDIANIAADGLLDPVLERGPIYRLPPDAPRGLS